jgi:putative ABC transport system permease protein
MHPFIQDFLISFRSLRRSPGFTLVAVLTLALGIAASSVIFSVVNATMLRPLPYPDSDRLVVVGWRILPELSPAAFLMVKNQTHVFSQTAAVYDAVLGVNISTPHVPQNVRSLQVSKEFFATLGVLPELGRNFSHDDDQPNALPTVVLSHEIWVQNFGGDRSALGQSLRINGASYKIIGVMPRRFRSYPEADIWVPLQLDQKTTDKANDYRIIGRLANGVSQQEVLRQLDGVGQEFHHLYPWSALLGTIVARPLQLFLAEGERQRFAVLSAAAALVFLIACTNVAILVLVRGAAGAQNIAVRAALGQPQGRLVFSLLSESLLLALMAGILGLILAKECLPLLLLLWPTNLPLAINLSIDWHVAFFTFGVSIWSCVLFGLAPALKLSRVNISQLLARMSGRASPGLGQVRTIRFLVGGQMALTVGLLAGTVLLVKSLLNLYAVDLGFDPAHLVVGQVSLSGERYRTTESTVRLSDQIIKKMEGMPGVEALAVMDGLPLEPGITIPIHPLGWQGSAEGSYRPVTNSYFSALRIPLRSGRPFLNEDTSGSTPVAILNESMARRWWPNSSPIGQFIQVDKEIAPELLDIPRQVVGVVGDIRESDLSAPARPTIFVPMAQTPDNISAFFNQRLLTSIVIRTPSRAGVSNQLQAAIQSVDPDLPLASYRPFGQFIDRSLANQRFLALLASVFGGFAFLLTLIGMQGLFSYQARLRRREIAVRMAIGATRNAILRMVVQQGTKLISFALLVGLAGSLVVRALLQSLLYNVQSISLIVILATGLVLGLVAALMILLTASRAASIEPMAVLRNE